MIFLGEEETMEELLENVEHQRQLPGPEVIPIVSSVMASLTIGKIITTHFLY